ncbi:23S rRNA (pseudouridine(1915)-N(3))-methyltransferase RlmH [Pelistega europaea]|uniref:Ribosomal RNA large subunit methyltransferase H n=1 Tax=Pelistega europaea TaxID=106147 RepID=A0A7Y4LAS3_9BURK|nr:23S rRNA (pseudouridine(1915)-N(3))-methyltransferase RlmH [Pelistega europaea]NOL50155.1 23S rRNA (pseudouridine(1915)-N(3))-methyltransferase RlmH [Pelistega europaea]
MKLYVIAVGNRMPKWVETAWEDYAKRMPADCAIELKEIKPEPRSNGKTPEQMMLAEAKRIEAALPTNAIRVVLDEHGKDITTVQLAKYIEQWKFSGQDVAIIIGGPDGLDASIKNSGNTKLRLSSLTLPHPMVRVLLAEQLYRAWSITVNHPYHRA